jgi:hypothetical protein
MRYCLGRAEIMVGEKLMGWFPFFRFRTKGVERPSYGEFLNSWLRVRKEIDEQVLDRANALQEYWPQILTEVDEHKGAQREGALDQEAWLTAVESCLWANAFLKMVQQIEEECFPQDWVALVLETVMRELEKEDKGCRIRYSRGMLQEYGESGRDYRLEHRQDYFGKWLWNANHQEEMRLPGQKIGRVLLGDVDSGFWYLKDIASPS